MTMDGDVSSGMVGGAQTAGDIEAEEKKREYSQQFCLHRLLSIGMLSG